MTLIPVIHKRPAKRPHFAFFIKIDGFINPQNMDENIKIAKRGGSVAKSAKDGFEKETGQNVISKLNARNKEMLEIGGRKD